MWVKLKVIKYLDIRGKSAKYQPGDWVKVPSNQGRLWISQGDAEIPGGAVDQLVEKVSGVIFTGSAEAAKKLVAPYKLTGTEGEPALKFQKTLWLDGSVPVRPEFIPVGFSLLDKWQVAIPLYSYDVLASNVGTEEEQVATKAVIRDLRVPLYDTRLVFIRRDPETEFLVELYTGHLKDGVNALHALLRAIYQAKPFILALPATWNSKTAHP